LAEWLPACLIRIQAEGLDASAPFGRFARETGRTAH